MLDSQTFEEAPIKLTDFIKQRSRWIKGHFQTYFVHVRAMRLFFEKGNIFAFANFNAFLLFSSLAFLYPVLSFASCLLIKFTNNEFLESVEHITSLNVAFGFLFCFWSFFNLSKDLKYNLKWRVFLTLISPFYFLLHTFASIIAVIEIFVCPHYWHKTPHNCNYNKKIFYNSLSSKLPK